MDDLNFDELDLFIEKLNEFSKKDRMLLVDIKRMQEFKESCIKLARIIKQTSPDAKIEYETNAMGAGIGTMCIETDEFVVEDIKLFISAIQFVTNIEFLPLTNGNIQIGITFYGLANEIKL